MAVTMEQVKELRERTGAGILDAKKMLEETGGNVDRAIDLLRERGMVKAAKKAGRATHEGVVYSYIHMGGKIGVLVELNCETDFVARNEGFRALAHDIALHIAAAAPHYTTRADVPADIVAREREVIIASKAQGKPAHIVDKIAESALNTYYKEIVLLEQPFVKDNDKTVEDLVKEAIAKIGENIVVRRFTRYAIGE